MGVLIVREYYGAVDGVSEPTEPDSVCIQLQGYPDSGLSNTVYNQFLGKIGDYSDYDGDNFKGYLDD